MEIDDSLLESIRMFAFFVANGTIAPDLLPPDGPDYRPHLVAFGSELEMLFVVFLRNLQRGASEDHSRRRAAMWLKSYMDSAYNPDPLLEDWETHM